MHSNSGSGAVPLKIQTVCEWLEPLGYTCDMHDENTLVVGHSGRHIAPVFVRCASNWLLLSMGPIIPPGAQRPSDLPRRLLAVNRDLRLAKFAYDEDGDVILMAELPTESLGPPELREVMHRMVRYVDHYYEYITGVA